jgi:hypothetical protein
MWIGYLIGFVIERGAGDAGGLKFKAENVLATDVRPGALAIGFAVREAHIDFGCTPPGLVNNGDPTQTAT